MNWLASALGVFVGTCIKTIGVQAFMRGVSDALVEKSVVSKNNQSLADEFNRTGTRSDHIGDVNGMFNNGSSSTK